MSTPFYQLPHFANFEKSRPFKIQFWLLAVFSGSNLPVFSLVQLCPYVKQPKSDKTAENSPKMPFFAPFLPVTCIFGLRRAVRGSGLVSTALSPSIPVYHYSQPPKPLPNHDKPVFPIKTSPPKGSNPKRAVGGSLFLRLPRARGISKKTGFF